MSALRLPRTMVGGHAKETSSIKSMIDDAFSAAEPDVLSLVKILEQLAPTHTVIGTRSVLYGVGEPKKATMSEQLALLQQVALFTQNPAIRSISDALTKAVMVSIMQFANRILEDAHDEGQATVRYMLQRVKTWLRDRMVNAPEVLALEPEKPPERAMFRIRGSPYDCEELDAVLWTIGRNDNLRDVECLPGGLNVPLSAKDLRLTDDITCDMSVTVDPNKEAYLGRRNVTAHVLLKADGPNVGVIKHFVQRCVANHANMKLGMDVNKRMYFEVTKDHRERAEAMFDRTKFETNRNIENLFLPKRQHDELRERLTAFLTKRDFYDKVGTPHTLGILLSGPPGTGKTSTIKAIAKFTNRHIFSVALDRVPSARALRKLFASEAVKCWSGDEYESVAKLKIPISERLYVLEDVDATSPIVLKRDYVPHVEVSPASSRRTVEEPNFTLSDLLNVLDGTVETPGRILVMTTNHPEPLDPALTTWSSRRCGNGAGPYGGVCAQLDAGRILRSK